MQLEVLSVDDGRKLWSHNGIPESAGLLGAASPAVEGEVVIAAYTSGELFALRVENGRAVWTDNLAASRNVNAIAGLADIRGRPVIDRGRVFAVSHSGRMACIDLRTGDRVWEQQIGSSHGPWVAGDYVFVLASDNQAVCLTRSDGKVRWARQLPRLRGREEAVGPDLLGRAGARRQPADRRLVDRRRAGRCRPAAASSIGEQRVSAGGFLGPVIADNTLYLLTDDANLSAYRCGPAIRQREQR